MNKAFIPLIIFLLFVALTINAQQVTINIKFDIDNGNYSESKVSISKNGAILKVIDPAKAKITENLEFDNDYLLTFLKKGYITKRISISTKNVPEDVQEDDLDFDFVVELFAQYEGINTVLFNQPVAKYFYDPKEDAFAYDTDYTKSIRAALASFEKEYEEKKQEVAVAPAQVPPVQDNSAQGAVPKAHEDARKVEEAKAAAALLMVTQKAQEEQRQATALKAQEDARKSAEETAKADAARIAEAKRKAAEAKAGEDKLKIEMQQAEEARKALEAKAGEDKRRAEVLSDEKKRNLEQAKAEEEQRQGIMRQAEELRKANEAKVAEESRQVAAAKASEDERRAREAKAADEQRKAAESKAADDARRVQEAKTNEDVRLLAQKKSEEEARLRAAELKALEEQKKAVAIAKAEEDKRLAAKNTEEQELLRKAAVEKAEEERRKAAEAKTEQEARMARVAAAAGEERKTQEKARAEAEKRMRYVAEVKQAEAAAAVTNAKTLLEKAPLKTKDAGKILSRNEKAYREGTKEITEITIEREFQTFIYRKVKHDWGGMYYFKNDASITKYDFDTETKAII